MENTTSNEIETQPSPQALTGENSVHGLFAEPVRDERICAICDGGPGNYGVCLCGHHAYGEANETSAGTDAESASPIHSQPK